MTDRMSGPQCYRNALHALDGLASCEGDSPLAQTLATRAVAWAQLATTAAIVDSGHAMSLDREWGTVTTDAE